MAAKPPSNIVDKLISKYENFLRKMDSELQSVESDLSKEINEIKNKKITPTVKKVDRFLELDTRESYSEAFAKTFIQKTKNKLDALAYKLKDGFNPYISDLLKEFYANIDQITPADQKRFQKFIQEIGKKVENNKRIIDASCQKMLQTATELLLESKQDRTYLPSGKITIPLPPKPPAATEPTKPSSKPKHD